MMASDPSTASRSLVSSAWLDRHHDDPRLRIVEMAGIGHEDKADYLAGHVPNARCWAWKDMLWDDVRRDFPDSETFARRMAAEGISNDTTVVVYGEDVMFGSYAWWVLTYCGHEDVRLLDGGRLAWSETGLALEPGEGPSVAPVQYRPRERLEGMRIFREQVLDLALQGGCLIDARSPEEFRGERLAPHGFPDVGAMRPGRIPGARHLHYSELLDEQKRFKSRQELEQIFASLVRGGGGPIVSYCRLSHRGTIIYFALTELLGLDAVKLYDGSWTEWGNLVGYPIEI